MRTAALSSIAALAAALALADDSRSVSLSPEQIRQRDIRVEVVTTAPDAEVTAPGTVAFDGDRIALIGPRLPAKVIQVARDLGDTVKAGDLVAVFDSVDLGKAKARHIAQRAEYATARAASEREDLLASQQISSEADRLEARARLASAQAELRASAEELRLYGMTSKEIEQIGADSTQRLSAYPLYSPIAGVIEVRDIRPGQSVAADSTPIEVVNADRMWLTIDASERDVGRLGVGQRVSFVAKALDKRAFEGRIDWVAMALDPITRTLRLRAAVDNPDHVLKAGMYGDARITTVDPVGSVWVPTAAVQTLNDDRVVFREDESAGRFEAVAVRTGREQQGRIEITHGLQGGQRIVTSGAFALMSVLAASAGPPDVD